jgi:hypothetical protein
MNEERCELFCWYTCLTPCSNQHTSHRCLQTFLTTVSRLADCSQSHKRYQKQYESQPSSMCYLALSPADLLLRIFASFVCMCQRSRSLYPLPNLTADRTEENGISSCICFGATCLLLSQLYSRRFIPSNNIDGCKHLNNNI